MKNVKGIATITLFDKDNKKIKEQQETNIVTNLIEDFISFNKMVSFNQNLKKTSYISQVSKNFKGFKESIGGLLLFDSKLPVDKKVTNHYKVSIASGGSKNDLSNPLIGSLNELETGDTTIDGKKAYRYTWDFGTSNANCTFETICLTTKDAGNRVLPDFRELYNDYPGNTNAVAQGYNIRNNGDIIYSTGADKICKIKKISNASLDTKFSVFSKIEEYQIVGWSDLSANGFIENDIYYVCGKNVSENKFYLLGINIDTMTVIESSKKELPGVTTIGGTKFFGLLEDLLITNARKSGSNLVWDVYDFSNNLFTASGYSTPFGALASASLRYCRIYKANNKYLTHFCTQYHTSSGYGTAYYSIVYMYKDSSKNRFMSKDGNRASDDFFLEKVSLDLNNGNITVATNNIEYVCFGGIEPLFTINVLDDRITKTEANTMKISYTLVFD